MAAKNSKGVTICVTKGGATPAALIPTGIAKESSGKRSEITVASVTGIVVGDLIKIPVAGTGFKELDGNSFIVASVGSGTFTLAGSDLTGTTGVLAASPSVQHYTKNDMVCLCLSDLKFNAEKGSTISVATYCSPSASIPSASTTAGTVDLAGFVDITAADYVELLDAEVDGVERIFVVKLPSNGEIIFPGVVGSMAWQIPLDGAVSYEASLSLGSRPRHLF